ncbi:MAG TPA: lysophospholipid acyltransferase family protein [Rhodanobacteraceae bacterium]|nr:lysophospholipid acyltransferase family protein [Rhodanobacteraceae bacterium]
MNPPSEASAPPGRADRSRPWRYACRAPLVLVHLAIALPLGLLVLNPLVARWSIAGETLDRRMIRWWSGALIRRFGMRIRAFGTPLPGAVMYVANHVSWLDIELMHSQRAIHFVAKSEIARWPLVGWLASRAGTIYHRRGDTHSLTAVMQRVGEHLRAGWPVGVFPEGASGSGDGVRTFHARIFQAALDADVPVQPVALRYGNDGRQSPAVPFGPGESFFANLLRVLGEPVMDAEIHFLEPVESTPDARKRMAEQSRARIARALGYETP